MQVPISVFLWFAGLTITAIAGVFVWAVNYVVKDNHEKNRELADEVKLIESDVKKVKENYLSRFERVADNITNAKQQMLDEIHNCHTQMIDIVHNLELKLMERK